MEPHAFHRAVSFAFIDLGQASILVHPQQTRILKLRAIGIPRLYHVQVSRIIKGGTGGKGQFFGDELYPVTRRHLNASRFKAPLWCHDVFRH